MKKYVILSYLTGIAAIVYGFIVNLAIFCNNYTSAVFYSIMWAVSFYAFLKNIKKANSK